MPNFVVFSEYINFTKSIFCTFKTDIAWSVGRMSPLDFGSALPRITRPLPPPDFKTLRHACDVIQFLNFTQFDPVVMIFFHFTIGFKLKSSDEMYREYLTFSFDCIALANSKVPLFPSLLPLNFIKWTMEVIRLFLYLWPNNKKITCPQCHKILIMKLRNHLAAKIIIILSFQL